MVSRPRKRPLADQERVRPGKRTLAVLDVRLPELVSRVKIRIRVRIRQCAYPRFFQNQKGNIGVKKKYHLSAKENQNILSVFIFGESVCNGIASAAQYMLSLLNVPSMIVYGTFENEPHVWNLIYLDGVPYFFDATLGITGSETVGDCSYAFLNLISRDIEKTHTFDMYLEIPECTEVSNNYYVKEGRFFTTFDENAIGETLASCYAAGTSGDIKCATDEVYSQIKQEFVENQKLADY